MAKIAEIVAREIINCLGNPGVEVDVVLAGGTIGRAALPSYRFPDRDEAIEDRNKRGHIDKAMLAARASVNNSLASKIVGMDVLDQVGIDSIMREPGEQCNKKNLGFNATLGVSLAVAKAAAASLNIPLYQYFGGCHSKQMPSTMMKVLGGGKYSGNSLDFQEFMIVPVGRVTFTEAMRRVRDVYYSLQSILRNCRTTSQGGADCLLPNLAANEEALAILLRAVKKAGYRPGKQIALAFNAAASDFFKEGVYNLPGEGFIKTPVEMVEYYTELVEEYPIISIQEGIAREDQEGWALFFERLGEKIQLVYEFMPMQLESKSLRQGIQSNFGNAIVLNLNQLATLSDILDMAGRAKKAGYTCIILNNTADAGIADIVVGINAAQIKGDTLAYAEQAAVYNQLFRIDEELARGKNRPKRKIN